MKNRKCAFIGFLVSALLVCGIAFDAWLVSEAAPLDITTYAEVLPSNHADANFGTSSAINSDTAIIGASNAAYIFVRSDGAWLEQQRITAPDGAAGDAFGAAVDISGETVIIGAPMHDAGASNAGAAYVFTRTGGAWSLQQKLTAASGAESLFGSSVALDGDTAVVGSPVENVGPMTDQGAARVFTRAGGVWTFRQQLAGADSIAFNRFGTSVAISGGTIAVGAPAVNANGTMPPFGVGAVYVFTGAGASWTQQQKLTASDGAASDGLGRSVGISGDTIIASATDDDVGANSNQGSAYIFTRAGSTWSQQAKLVSSDGAANDLFGNSVAVSGDRAVVGVQSDDVGAAADRGSAILFTRTGSAWSQEKLVTADRPGSFGSSVDIAGTDVIVGARFTSYADTGSLGSAYIFRLSPGPGPMPSPCTWNQQAAQRASDAAAGDEFATSVAISGNTAIFGAPKDNSFAGAAYVFIRVGAAWSQQQKLSVAGSNQFGISVAIDGNTVVIGASQESSQAGAAYVFTRSGSTWTQQQKLTASDAAAGDFFGSSVGISGNTAIVGAHLDNNASGTDAGSAYIFTRSGTTWTQQQQLTASNGDGGDRFGFSVGVDGNAAIVGAPGDTTSGASGAGSAYVFRRSGVAWSQERNLVAYDAQENDQGGTAVSIDGDVAVFGAPAANTAGGADAGAAYAFVRSSGVWAQRQKLIAADGSAGDLFGKAVAVSADSIAAGAPGSGAGSPGFGYVFGSTGSFWAEQQKLAASDGSGGDQFGISIGISGASIVSGSPLDDTAAGANAGSGYVFTRTCPNPPATISGTVTYGTVPVGNPTRFVPGVLLSAAGSVPINASSNAAGSYSLSGFGAGSYTVTPSKSGDVNGSISGLDAARVAQHVAGLITLTPNQQIAGDATNNGSLSGLDAARIAQFAAGLSNPGIAGQWKFVPTSRNYASVANSMTGENYEAILVGDVTGNWTPAAAPGPAADQETRFSSEKNSRFRESTDEPAFAAGTDLSAATVIPTGDRFVLPIPIGDTTGKGIVAYEFVVEYDPELLTPDFEPATNDGTLSAGWAVTTNATRRGVIKVVAYGGRDLTGAGTLLNLNFRGLRQKTESMPVRFVSFKLNDHEVLELIGP